MAEVDTPDQENVSVMEIEQTDYSPILDVLQIPLIGDNILLYLTYSDVLECSLVDKFWRKMCRRFMRVQKQLKINLNWNVCSRLKKLDDLLALAATEIFPFSGLNLVLRSNPEYCQKVCSNIELDIELLYPNIFQKLPLKQFYIDFPQRVACFGEKLLQKLLTRCAPTKTEFLEIINWPDDIPSVWDYLNIKRGNPTDPERSLCQSTWLPHVIRTRLPRNNDMLVFEIVSSSPNLKNLGSPLPAWMFHEISLRLENPTTEFAYSKPQFPDRRYNIVRYFIVTWFEYLVSLAQVKPMLTYMALHPFPVCQHRSQTFRECLLTILDESRNALQTLKIADCPRVLPCVISKKVGPLVNLHRLFLDLRDSYQEFKDIILFFESIAFETLLPALTHVGLSIHPGLMQNKPTSHLFEKAIKPKFKCFSVRKLEFFTWAANSNEDIHKMWSSLAETFPNVKYFGINTFHQHPFFGEFMEWIALPWKPSLKTLSLFAQTQENKSILRCLTELLENFCCNVSFEELLEMNICGQQLQSWNFASTRRIAFCFDFGNRMCCVGTFDFSVCVEITRLIIHLLPKKPCGGPVDAVENAIWRDRYNRISSWIRIKMPNFSLQLDFDRCGQDCNPVYFHAGRIESQFIPRDILSTINPFKRTPSTWILHF